MHGNSIYSTLLTLLLCLGALACHTEKERRKTIEPHLEWELRSADTLVYASVNNLQESTASSFSLDSTFSLSLQLDILEAKTDFVGLEHLVSVINRDLLEDFYVREFEDCNCLAEKLSAKLTTEARRFNAAVLEYQKLLSSTAAAQATVSRENTTKEIRDSVLFSDPETYISLARFTKQSSKNNTEGMIVETYNYNALTSKRLRFEDVIVQDSIPSLLQQIRKRLTTEATENYAIDLTRSLNLQEMSPDYLNRIFYLSPEGFGFIFIDESHSHPEPQYLAFPAKDFKIFIKPQYYSSFQPDASKT